MSVIAVSAADLRAYLNAGAGVGDPVLAPRIAVARELLATAGVGNSNEDGSPVVPLDVQTSLVLEVAAELYRRRDSSTGQSQFAKFDQGTQPVRGPRDPLTQVWPIIRRYVLPF